MAGVSAAAAVAVARAEPWARHTIDDTSRGADGVRFGDFDGDGWPDCVVGWEEGGVVRAYLHPGAERVRQRWPSLEVGNAPSVEDAVFVDLDGDGRPEVVSACEGRRRELLVHRAADASGSAWTTEPVPGSAGAMMWMFSLPLDVDGRDGIDLVAGGKGEGAAIGWWVNADPGGDPAAWRWSAWRPCGWLMSLVAADMDGDGDTDVLATDRRGSQSGCFWLENPGSAGADGGEPWREHTVGAAGEEVLFLGRGDIDGDGLPDVAVPAKPGRVLLFYQRDRAATEWDHEEVRHPDWAGRAKAVSIGDIDGDGRADLVATCEGATAPQSGVFWLRRSGSDGAWQAHDISGPAGVKFDLAPLIDLDRDGDLDVVTTEEAEGLGVVWYENPTVP